MDQSREPGPDSGDSLPTQIRRLPADPFALAMEQSGEPGPDSGENLSTQIHRLPADPFAMALEQSGEPDHGSGDNLSTQIRQLPGDPFLLAMDQSGEPDAGESLATQIRQLPANPFTLALNQSGDEFDAAEPDLPTGIKPLPQDADGSTRVTSLPEELAGSKAGAARAGQPVRRGLWLAFAGLLVVSLGGIALQFRAPSDLPTEEELRRLYPYGSEGFQSPAGHVAPPAALMSFKLRKSAPCLGPGSDTCHVYAYARDDFAGSMKVYRVMGAWYRYSDEGMPFSMVKAELGATEVGRTRPPALKVADAEARSAPLHSDVGDGKLEDARGQGYWSRRFEQSRWKVENVREAERQLELVLSEARTAARGKPSVEAQNDVRFAQQEVADVRQGRFLAEQELFELNREADGFGIPSEWRAGVAPNPKTVTVRKPWETRGAAALERP